MRVVARAARFFKFPKGDKAVITGFGTFSVRKRAPRPGRNPQTGAQIQISARKTPGFTAGKTLKRGVR